MMEDNIYSLFFSFLIFMNTNMHCLRFNFILDKMMDKSLLNFHLFFQVFFKKCWFISWNCTFLQILEHFLLVISGLERKAFDNKNVTFEEHTRTEHNMWHYLYFIVLIKVKDPTEFTGPESYVHEMVKVKIITISI